MGSSAHTLEWIDKPAHTVLNGGVVVKMVYGYAFTPSIREELALVDRQKSQS